MADVHITIRPIDASGNQVVFHNPAQPPLPAGAGQQVAQTNGKTSGQVSNSSVIFNSPA